MSKIVSMLGAGAITGVAETHEICTTTAGGVRTACGIPVQVEDMRSFKRWLEEEHAILTCKSCVRMGPVMARRTVRRTLHG